MRSPLIALVVALLLAGCSTSSPATPQPTASAPVGASPEVSPPSLPAADGVPAPAWRVGDWWQWTIVSRDSPESFEVTTVVTSVGPDGYRVGVTELAPALHAMADHVITMGVVTIDLAWEVHDGPARILQFPLRDGVTWDGVEEGRAMRFVANATRAMGPDGEVDAFEAMGETEHGPGVAFVYAPSVGHFLRYSIYYGGDSPYATATLAAFGHGRTDGIMVESDDVFFGFAGTPPPRVPPRVPQPDTRATFEVPANATHLFLACFAGGQGEQRASVISPTGAKLVCARSSPLEGGYGFAMDVQPAAPGRWFVSTVTTGGFIEVEISALRVGT